MFFKKKSSNSLNESSNSLKGKEKETEKETENNVENDNNKENENENDKRDLSLFLDRSFLSAEKFPFSLHLFSEQTQTIQDYLPLQFLLPSTDLLWNSQNSYQYILPEKIASKVSNVSHASIFILNTISQLIITTCSLAKSGASASMGVSRNALVRAFSTAENMQKSKMASSPQSKENEKFYKSISNYTNLGIKSVNYLFSCAEMITYATFHLTEKSLLFSLSWIEQFFVFIDTIFGDTDVSHDITTFISLFYEDISDFFEKQNNVISKFSGLLKFIKAITIYVSILIVMRNPIKNKRKNQLLYDGLIEIEKGYTETLIQEEENEALMQYLEDEVIPEYKASENKNDDNDSKIEKTKEENNNKASNKDKEKENEDLKPVKISFMKNYSFPDYLLSLDKNKIKSKDNEVIQQVKNSLSKDKECFLNVKDNKQYVDDLEEILEQSLYENESVKEMFNSFEYNRSSYIYQLCKSQSDEVIKNVNSEQEQKNRLKDLVYFVKFACGAYGKFNTKIIYNINNNKKEDEKLIRRLHPNDYSFSLHTKIPLKCILSSSYHYSNSKNESSDAPKLDYVIAVDHLTNSVVLTICGTIGISDLLTNLNCGYDNIELNGKTYSVHKNIYESAKNFAKSSSIPLTVISKALEVHSTYRLILCGHSYGGAVAALLGVLWSDPQKPYVTNSTSGIPPNRSIHAYVYGAPSCMSYELSIHYKPLITNIINHNDIIPYLSHGFMNDQKNCCKMIFSYLNNEIPPKKQTKRRSFIGGFFSKASSKQDEYEEEEEEEDLKWIDEVLTRSFNTLGKRSETKKQQDDKWFTEIYGKCKKLMTSEKIYPPGYLFIIEETSETYTNPNTNINEKSSNSKENNNNETVLVPAIAFDTEANAFESDQETITIYTNKKNKEIQNNESNENNENDQQNSNKNKNNGQNNKEDHDQNLIDESLLNSNVDTDNSSFDKMEISFNDLNNQLEKEEKSFLIDKGSDIFTTSNASDINNNKALLNCDISDSKLIFDHQIINISNGTANQQSENISNDNGQSETITRIKLYECQDIKKQLSDILISKNMFSENKPYTYEELVIALGKVVFGYSLY